MNDRRKTLKMTLLSSRRVVDAFGKVQACEGQAIVPHTCSGGLHMNEVFFTRKDVMKMTAKDKAYIFHEINCSIVCAHFHTEWGHSRKFREWFDKKQRKRYGDEAVDQYLLRFPTKLSHPTHLQSGQETVD